MEQDAIQLFHRIHKLVEISKRLMPFRFVRQVCDRLGLSHKDFEALCTLYNIQLDHAEGGTIKQICALMPVNQPAVSMLLNKLADKGLVLRKENPDDRRSTFLTLSPHARQEFDAMAIAQGKATNEFFAVLPEGHKTLLFQFIDTMTDYFKQHS